MFRKLLQEFIYGNCPRWKGFGAVSFCSGNIAKFLEIRLDDYKDWAVRFQVDLLTNGARLVMVAVRTLTHFPDEDFNRPYNIGPLIPRTPEDERASSVG